MVVVHSLPGPRPTLSFSESHRIEWFPDGPLLSSDVFFISPTDSEVPEPWPQDAELWAELRKIPLGGAPLNVSRKIKGKKDSQRTRRGD
jgi:hypothetical protein